MLAVERSGTIVNVVFPTGIDRRDDLDSRDRFYVYYGMADNRIGPAEHCCGEPSCYQSEQGVFAMADVDRHSNRSRRRYA